MIARVAFFLMLVSAAAHAQTLETQTKRYRVGPNPVSVALADLNEDGVLDLLVANRGRLMDIRDEHPAEENVSYFIGREDHGFDAQPPLPCGFGPYQVVVANIDALKAPDIVVVNFHAARNRDLTLLRNLDSGVFEPRHFSVPDDGLRYTQMRDSEGKPIFSAPGLTSVAVADINADGYRDALATGWSSDALVLFPGRPDTYFGEPIVTALTGGPRDLAVEDLDGDGVLDLAVTLYSTDEIALLRGTGKGEFELMDKLPARGKMPQRIRVADMDGDHRKDLVITYAQGDDSVVVFFGDGGFSFQVAQEYRLGKNRFQREYGVQDVVVRDFNGDDKQDIALACSDAGAVVVLRNTSSGKDRPLRFEPETYPIEGGQPHALAAGDITRDGRPDLAVALWGADSVALLFSRP
jgi:hypothetical protein